MKILFYCIIILNLFSSCSKKSLQKMEIANTTTNKTFTYLALGDSYTIGEAVSQSESFPYQLSAGLARTGYTASEVKVIARTGWTTDELKAAIAKENLTRKFDVVTLLIGVNNQFRGYSSTTYRTEFTELLNMAIAFANGDKSKVFVVSIPDWGATPYAAGQDRNRIAKEIDLFNSINKDESLKAGVSYTDITIESRKALTDPSLVAVDGLHPSGKMYAYWAEQLLPKVAAQLK